MEDELNGNKSIWAIRKINSIAITRILDPSGNKTNFVLFISFIVRFSGWLVQTTQQGQTCRSKVRCYENRQLNIKPGLKLQLNRLIAMRTNEAIGRRKSDDVTSADLRRKWVSGCGNSCALARDENNSGRDTMEIRQNCMWRRWFEVEKI